MAARATRINVQRDNRPDRLADDLIRRIYLREYAPGQHLPPERELAVALGTDRTSMRIALAQLRRMNVIRAVQGSGTRVLDYRDHAGIEFLLHVFRIEDTPDESAVLRQMFEYFHLAMPGVWALVARRATDDQLASIEQAYRRQLEQAQDLETTVSCAIEAIDQAAVASGNLLFPLIFRSTLPLRKRLLRHLFRDADVVARATANLEWVSAIRDGSYREGGAEAAFRRHMEPIFRAGVNVLSSIRGDIGDDDGPRFARRGAFAPSFLGVADEPLRGGETERVSDDLLRRIYSGEFAAGARLPAERELAPLLGTDRTSLRMALAQLKRMNLVSAVQGSGTIVNDYRRNGGIDFLAHLCRMPDTPIAVGLGRDTIDYVIASTPALTTAAIRRRMTGCLERLERACEEALTFVGDPADAAELAVRTQDLLAAATGNVIVAMVHHSTRPLRLRQMQQVARVCDLRLRARLFLDMVAEANTADADAAGIGDRFGVALQGFYSGMRERL